MVKNTSLLIMSALIFVHSFSGCSSRQSRQAKNESRRIDSLIEVRRINDCTITVKFGYDAITAISTVEGIVLVDAGIATSITARYKRIIENEFHSDNIAYIINSHGHHDHLRGNSIFPQAQVIGHVNCQMDASEGGDNPESLLMSAGKTVQDYDQQLHNSVPGTDEWNDIFTQKMRYTGAYLDLKKGTSFKLPDITFTDSMKLEIEDTSFEMIYFGKFHSNSDILIYVPEIRVLFTGDLFSKYGRPGMSSSSVNDEKRWMTAIKWIQGRISDTEIIIDGHGQTLSTDDVELFINNVLKKCSNK
jgi:glyoxylase-like metal-dependent hydrolase (beta-lactamase superfamily II)